MPDLSQHCQRCRKEDPGMYDYYLNPHTSETINGHPVMQIQYSLCVSCTKDFFAFLKQTQESPA